MTTSHAPEQYPSIQASAMCQDPWSCRRMGTHGGTPAPAISSMTIPWWDMGLWECGSIHGAQPQFQQGFNWPLSFPKHLWFNKYAYFLVECYFLVKFPAICNQELCLFPFRGFFLQQSNASCSICDKDIFNAEGMSGNCFSSLRAQLHKIQCLLSLCHVVKENVWAITVKHNPVKK